MSILNITEAITEDTSIDEYEVHEYEPITGTNLNNPAGEIRINIGTQDIFTHPSESYLVFVGRLLTNNNAEDAYVAATNISLTNNGLMYLFKNISYKLNEQTIESLTNPGQATTMLGLLKYPDDFNKSQGLNQLWYKDTGIIADNTNTGFEVRRQYIIQDPEDKDTFSFRVPLKHIFGFCEDYNKVIYGMKQTLTLTRNNDMEAIFKNHNPNAVGDADLVPDGKVKLTKISWFVPHVLPALEEKTTLYKLIEKKEKFPVGYRKIQCESTLVTETRTFNWRLSVNSSPEVQRFIIIGFQTNRKADQKLNSAVFDNLDIENIYVMLNAVRYPAIDYNLKFNNHQYSRAYGDVALFRSKFFNMDELVSNPSISPADYKTLYPLFVFDVSKQSERIKYSSTDTQVKMFFGNNVAPNTEAYAVIISDRLLSFHSDGNKMTIVI